MVKVSVPLVKMRGQLLSDGPLFCAFALREFGGACFVWTLGLGASGSGCCAWAGLRSRETTKIKVQNTDKTLVAGLRICMTRPSAHPHCVLLGLRWQHQSLSPRSAVSEAARARRSRPPGRSLPQRYGTILAALGRRRMAVQRYTSRQPCCDRKKTKQDKNWRLLVRAKKGYRNNANASTADHRQKKSRRFLASSPKVTLG